MHQPGSSGGGRAGSGGFLDAFLPRMLANTLAMVGVALSVLWIVSSEHEEQQGEVDELTSQVMKLRSENDRMRLINHELASEVHRTELEADVLRWQLRYTEERLDRAESEGARSSGFSLPPMRRSSAPVDGSDAEIEVIALDSEAQAFLADQLALIADGSDREHAGPTEVGSGLDLVDFEPSIELVRGEYTSQLQRDRALREWRGVVEDAVVGECTRGLSAEPGYRCAEDLRTRLWGVSDRAVDCVLSGNANPDYVGGLERHELPSHSVPLDRGAIMLCDGALENL